MKPAIRYGVAIAAAACTSLALAACGTSGAANQSSSSGDASGTVNVDVGLDKPVKLPKGKLRVGIFMNAQSNQWQQNLAAAAKKQGEAYGWDVKVLDFNFDQQKQTDALIQAATQHTYDAVAVVPIDGNQSCKVLTTTLPQNGILVVTVGGSICGLDNKPGDQAWAPETYNHNTVAPSFDYDKLFMEKAAEAFPGPQTVAMVVGAEENGTTIVLHQIMSDFEKAHPDFHVADFINTDFTTPTTFTAVQNYLQAHPKTSVILSDYTPDMSRGVMQALQSLNLVGKVKVGDMGGAQYTVDQIKSGGITFTMPYYPATDGKTVMESIKAAQDGGTPRRIADDVPGGLSKIPVVTKDNVDTFKAEY